MVFSKVVVVAAAALVAGPRAVALAPRMGLSLDVRRPLSSCPAILPSPISLPAGAAYVEDDDVVLASAVARAGAGVPSSVVAYARAGPRRSVARKGPGVAAAVVTCGGLCPGLNTVTQELFRCLRSQYGVGRVLGALGGYAGLAEGHWLEMDEGSAASLYRTGGTVLGTSRGKRDAAVDHDSHLSHIGAAHEEVRERMRERHNSAAGASAVDIGDGLPARRVRGSPTPPSSRSRSQGPSASGCGHRKAGC